MSDTRLLQDAFGIYYQNAMNDIEQKQLPSAKRNLLLASETLLKLAKMTDGPLRKTRLAKAEELVKLADRLSRMKQLDANRNDASKDLQQFSDSAQQADTEDTGASFRPEHIPDVYLDDVAGLEEVKEEIRKQIIEPRKYPEIYKKFRKKLGGGVLLYGVPGTGKTMIAQAIANEIDAEFFSVKSSDIASKWFGDAEKNVRLLFQEARKHKNAIIFFDEFEALGAKRDSYSTVMKRLVPELLAQMQGFEKSDNTLLLIAATNRPWDIDSAFLRPGRFHRSIYVPLPDEKARKAIIEHNLKGIGMAQDVDVNRIVELTKGFSGADIADNFCERLKDYAIARTIEHGTESVITNEDIVLTSQQVRSSVQHSDLEKIAKYEKGIGKS